MLIRRALISDSSRLSLLECAEILLKVDRGYSWRLLDELLLIHQKAEFEFWGFQSYRKHERTVLNRFQNEETEM